MSIFPPVSRPPSGSGSRSAIPRSTGLLDTVRSLFLRPAWSFSLVAAGILFGLGSAQLAATHTRAGAGRDMEARYVKMIDPLIPKS